MDRNTKNLLPQGFYDSLDDVGYKEIVLNFSIIENLNKRGFKLVRPAIAEFEGSLDKDLLSEQFKVTDPVSGKMMVIRNDITPQISRIVKDRYFAELSAKKMLKLSYTGQILKKFGKGKYQERQLTQTGFELIGGAVVELDLQALKVVIEILKDINIEDFTIDFCIPNLSEIIFKELGIKKSAYSETQKNIEEKNLSALKQDEKTSKIADLIRIYEKSSDIKSSITSLAKVKDAINSPQGKELIDELISLLGKLDNVDVNINLLERSNFSYHEGVCFSIISKATYEELGRGGRYKIFSGDREKQIDATGFTFMLNPILRMGI